MPFLPLPSFCCVDLELQSYYRRVFGWPMRFHHHVPVSFSPLYCCCSCFQFMPSYIDLDRLTNALWGQRLHHVSVHFNQLQLFLFFVINVQQAHMQLHVGWQITLYFWDLLTRELSYRAGLCICLFERFSEASGSEMYLFIMVLKPLNLVPNIQKIGSAEPSPIYFFSIQFTAIIEWDIILATIPFVCCWVVIVHLIHSFPLI